MLEAQPAPGPQPGRQVAPGPRLSRRLQAGDHVTEILEVQADGLEGLDDVLVRDMKKKGIHPKDITLLARGRRLAAGRVRRREQGGVGRQGPQADGPAQEGAERRRR